MVTISKINKLNDDNWVLYYASWCGHCKKIKSSLSKKKWDLINKVDCAIDRSACPRDVTGFPTWKNLRTGAHWDGVGVFR